jgi:hypothetical protein
MLVYGDRGTSPEIGPHRWTGCPLPAKEWGKRVSAEVYEVYLDEAPGLAAA